jgi:hypothetical protein
LREAGLNIGVIEAVAADGTGIRETFVFAVRLALDRVREQLRERTLVSGRPEIDSGEALLAQMQKPTGRRRRGLACRRPCRCCSRCWPKTTTRSR